MDVLKQNANQNHGHIGMGRHIEEVASGVRQIRGLLQQSKYNEAATEITHQARQYGEEFLDELKPLYQEMNTQKNWDACSTLEVVTEDLLGKSFFHGDLE
jgi:hypothetical protein